MKLDEVIRRETGVRCRTEEQAKTFLAACDRKGLIWGGGDKLTECTEWRQYRDNTCYSPEYGRMYYGNICDEINYIEFTDIDEFKPHELTAMEFLEKFGGMCGRCVDCRDCPMFSENNSFNEDCRTLMNRHPAEAIRIVSEWEEPKQVKTIMDDFFEKNPKAKKTSNGTPKVCAESCGYVNGCNGKFCSDCWHTPLSETEETK